MGGSEVDQCPGVYPLIACAVGAEVVYATEARSNDTSTSINWARSLGLFEEEAELNAFLRACDGTPSVPIYFILEIC